MIISEACSICSCPGASPRASLFQTAISTWLVEHKLENLNTDMLWPSLQTFPETIPPPEQMCASPNRRTRALEPERIYILLEKKYDYVDDSAKRMKHWQAGGGLYYSVANIGSGLTYATGLVSGNRVAYTADETIKDGLGGEFPFQFEIPKNLNI